MLLLKWDGSGFSEAESKDEGIFLELDEENERWVFSYTPGESLISRRTALRRANEIARVGFPSKDGKRVGVHLPLHQEVESSADLPADLKKSQRKWYT